MEQPIPSRPRLLVSALLRALLGILFLVALVFIPAGTLRYWQAWLYFIVLFVPLLGLAMVLLIKDPQLLARRMDMRERRGSQKLAIALSGLVLLAVFLVPALDYRVGWSHVPPSLVIFADVIILLGYILWLLTVRVNRFAARVVEVQQNQVLVNTGPYAFVRHPMYLSIIMIFCATPIALGSYWGLIPAFLLPLALVIRIADEERLLRQELTGYQAYCGKVRFRLLPYIW